MTGVPYSARLAKAAAWFERGKRTLTTLCTMISLALKVVEAPSRKPPPYIHTITGTGAAKSRTDSDGRKTFTVRQSSETPSTWKNDDKHLVPPIYACITYVELYTRCTERSSVKCGHAESVDLHGRREAQVPKGRFRKWYPCIRSTSDGTRSVSDPISVAAKPKSMPEH